MDKKMLLSTAIAGVVALGATMTATTAKAAEEKVKCYGAKAAKNDCGTKGHACAGHASADAKSGKLAADEWAFAKGATADDAKKACEKMEGTVK